MSASKDNVPFFKKKSRPTTSRQKRSPSPPASALTVPVPSTSKSEVVLPSRKAAANLLSAGTRGTKRSASERDDEAEVNKEGLEVKWTAAGSHQGAALDILAGDEAAELLAKRAKKERNDRIRAGEVDPEEYAMDDGQYHGQKAYRSHIQKSKEIPKAMRTGPQRNTSTIRTVTIVDYQPDVCKDYKGACSWCHLQQRD